MNQFFLDELRCIGTDLNKKKCKPRAFIADEINVIGDESALGAYLAGFRASVAVKEDEGHFNVVTDGKLRNQKLYDEIIELYGEKEYVTVLKDYDEYISKTDAKKGKHFYYVANIELPEYKDEAFVEKKLKNLQKWLDYSESVNGDFIFIPIFNFANPFPYGIAACSERELEAICEYDSECYQGRILLRMEELCRASMANTNNSIKVVRFDNLIGPFVEDTSNVGIGAVIDELINNNKITMYASDSITNHSGCYIRQAVTAVHIVDLKGKNGNIYNAANYRFTMHNVKNALYSKFRMKNLDVSFVNDTKDEVPKENYDCLGNIKIKNLGWKIVTPLKEAVYRAALAKADEEYAAGFYVSVYQGKLDRVKKIEMDIIAEIDRVCKENDITYFLVGGTLLGAIRHQGFIPWDDDMDIGMLRDDYDKFRRVCPEALQKHMSYQSPSNEKTSHYVFDKVRLKDTYFNTKFSNKFNNMENCIFIDVLAFDKTSNNKLMQKVHIKLIKILRRVINIRWVNVARKGIHYRKTKIFLPLMRLIPFGFYHRLLDATLKYYNNKNTGYLIDGVGLNIDRGAFPAEWFGEFEDVQYENMTFKVPVGYDNYLRMWYGDRYMELLPLSARFSGHKILRLDLGKYLLEETEQMHAHENHLLGELYEDVLDD